MRLALFSLLAATLLIGFTPEAANAVNGPVVVQEVIEHGGGCRKSSSPGQCCHMETRTGRVHCH